MADSTACTYCTVHMAQASLRTRHDVYTGQYYCDGITHWLHILLEISSSYQVLAPFSLKIAENPHLTCLILFNSSVIIGLNSIREITGG